MPLCSKTRKCVWRKIFNLFLIIHFYSLSNHEKSNRTATGFSSRSFCLVACCVESSFVIRERFWMRKLNARRLLMGFLICHHETFHHVHKQDNCQLRITMISTWQTKQQMQKKNQHTEAFKLTTIDGNLRWTVIHDTINLIASASSRLVFPYFFLNFLGVIKLCILLYHIICVCGWIKALNQIGLLSYNFYSSTSRENERMNKWVGEFYFHFIFHLLSFTFSSFLKPSLNWRIFLFSPRVFALIKLCFDCHFAAEYVIKADWGEGDLGGEIVECRERHNVRKNL